MMAADPQTEALSQALTRACAGRDDIDIAEVALLLAALDLPDRDLGPYRAHLAEIARAIRGQRDAYEAEVRRHALAHLLYAEYSYVGDGDLYEAPENANLMNVIDRRAGLPVALGILYLHAARAAGWVAHGISFPGHFLVQVEGEDGVALLDPFSAGRPMKEADLYGILRRLVGPAAKVEDGHLEPVSDRAVLIRLLNNLKTRAIQGGDAPRAMELLGRMQIVAPREPSFPMELGQLLDRDGQPTAARGQFERALGLAGEGALAERAREAISGIKRKLN